MGFCHPLLCILPQVVQSLCALVKQKIMVPCRPGVTIRCNKVCRMLSSVFRTWEATHKWPPSPGWLESKCFSPTLFYCTLLNLPMQAASDPNTPPGSPASSLHHPEPCIEHFHGNNLFYKRYSKYLLFLHTLQIIWV